MNVMTPSDTLVKFLKTKENCAKWNEALQVFLPYPDTGGLSTIGWGHKLTHYDIEAGIFTHGLSQGGCDLLFLQDLKPTVTFVNKLNFATNPTQGQFDCMVDFTWNCGMGTAVTLIKMGIQYVPSNLMHFIHDARGQVEPGLISRRQQDIAWWSGATSWLIA
jgi:GH24 family phage-related lysozyme (muramidase)